MKKTIIKSNLSIFGGTVGIIIYLIGVYFTIDHKSYGTKIQWVGLVVLSVIFAPILIEKTYNYLVRRKS